MRIDVAGISTVAPGRPRSGENWTSQLQTLVGTHPEQFWKCQETLEYLINYDESNSKSVHSSI